ncbi:MAG TPA: hypothetical protein VH583_20680 [Vicinamibacterales bacterium]|jgi:hypothetical protein
MTRPAEHVPVAPLMSQIERDARADLRSRLVKHGVTAYSDERIFERVSALLHHASEGRDPNALLLPELLDDEGAWALEPNLTLSSHRASTGAAILFVKRRILLPLTRWLFEYSQDNFRRQDRLNRILLACIEELAIENARLRADLDARRT